MKRSNRVLLVGIAFVCAGALILLGTRFLSQQRSSHHQSMKVMLTQTTATPTVVPTFIPTSILAPGQKTIYTFYIRATAQKAAHGELVLKPSDTGKTFTVDIGTFIVLYLGTGIFHISQSSPQAIFKNNGPAEVVHLPLNASGAYTVFRDGFGTITAIESN